MLRLGNRDEREVGFEPASTPAPSQPSGSWSNTPAESTRGETVIGEHISIEGTIRASENVIIEGKLKGSIEIPANQLTIGVKGQVEADISAESVVISGRLVGNVMARNKVQVTKSADFSGQIKAKRVAIEDGAYIKASIELEREDKKPSENKPANATAAQNPPKEAPKAQVVK